MTFPWRHVEKDRDGITTIHVNDEDLSNFPKFMDSVLKERLGVDQGVVKVQLDDSIVSPTSLQSLINIAKKHYSTPEWCEHTKKMELPKIEEQTFYYGSHDKDLFGYKTISSKHQAMNKKNAKPNRDYFLREISMPSAYFQKSTSEQLLERSLDSLIDYYWATIRRLSSKSGGMDLQEDEIDMKKLQDFGRSKRHLYGLEECAPVEKNVSLHSNQHHVSNEKKGGGNMPSILYAAGVPVPDLDCQISPNFSMCSLGTVMDVIPTKIPGISSPFLYFGMELSSFAWHIEDMSAFSINYLHFGAPCIWFIVPPMFFKVFKEWAQHFPLDRSHMACTNVLGASHKYLMASASFLKELGIPVQIVVQRERELILLYPYAAHSGFKTGLNVQQAVNFMDPWSVELSIFAPTCECFETCVNIDLKEVIAVTRPDILQFYVNRDLLGLVKALGKNKYLMDLGILPSMCIGSTEASSEIFGEMILLSLQSLQPNLQNLVHLMTKKSLV